MLGQLSLHRGNFGESRLALKEDKCIIGIIGSSGGGLMTDGDVSPEVVKLLTPHLKAYKSWIGSAQFRDWENDRRRKVTTYAELLSNAGISVLTEVELRQLVSSLWAFGAWGNKDYLVRRLLDAVGLDKLKESLMDLLWGSEPLHARYDRFRTRVKYLGPASVTELLAFVHPKECGIWNDRAREALRIIGVLPDLVKVYAIGGEDYERVCSTYRDILRVLSNAGIPSDDLLDVDLFLYKIAVTKAVVEEEKRPQDYEFDHDEVKEKLVEVGQWLGFEADKEVQIAKGARVDVIWTVRIGNLGVVKYIFEVHKTGPPDRLLLNLQRARRNPAVQKQIVVSNTAGLENIRGEAETLGEEFTKSLAYMEADDALKVASWLKDAWEIINRLNLVRPE